MRSFCVENLLFYLYALDFRQLPEDQLKKVAQEMWKMFFVEGSVREINVDDYIKEGILSKINTGRVDRDTFTEAERKTYDLLRFSIFPLWKNSDLYKEALEDAGLEGLNTLRVTAREHKRVALDTFHGDDFRKTSSSSDMIEIQTRS